MRLRWSHKVLFPRRSECPLLPHLDLRQRLRVLVLVRFVVAFAIVLGAPFASAVVGIEDLAVGSLCLLAAALFLCNLVTYVAIRPYRHSRESAEGARVFLERVLHFSVATDFIGLTVALWLVGGPFSPFKAFFIFNVIIASVLLSRRAAFTHALVAFTLLAALVISTWQGWIPGHYPRGAVAEGTSLSGQYVFTVLMVQGLLIMLTALLTTHLMSVLRDNTQKLVESNLALARMSQLRQDFLHIALHNLRSPVGVASMHLSNLANGYGGPLTESQQDWIGRSQSRLHELTKFLHDLECLAALETGELEQQAEMADIGAIVTELVEDNRDLVERSGHTLAVEAPADRAEVKGIPRLIREALANYLTNAIKYTPDGGRIRIRVLDAAGFVRVEVEDNGIGIAEKDQKRLFCEFVRIPRADTPLGEVAGSGLGLYIVQRIAEMHGASIGIQSREGEGSTFSIAFPKSGQLDSSPAAPLGTIMEAERRARA